MIISVDSGIGGEDYVGFDIAIFCTMREAIVTHMYIPIKSIKLYTFCAFYFI